MRADAGRFKSPRTAAKWSPMEDFVLASLVGKVDYRQIALRLGRSPGAVQRRASYKGLSARRNWHEDKQARSSQMEARLLASEDDLAPYLVPDLSDLD